VWGGRQGGDGVGWEQCGAGAGMGWEVGAGMARGGRQHRDGAGWEAATGDGACEGCLKTVGARRRRARRPVWVMGG